MAKYLFYNSVVIIQQNEQTMHIRCVTAFFVQFTKVMFTKLSWILFIIVLILTSTLDLLGMLTREEMMYNALTNQCFAILVDPVLKTGLFFG